MHVKKKNDQIRFCIDFFDLNETCLKDEFQLPNINMLLDATSRHSIFSFMDGFSDYSEIKMHPLDAERLLQDSYGQFYYTPIPFGLKNAKGLMNRL